MGKKKGGDYDGWILRMVEKAEDIEYANAEQAWLDFASKMIEKAYGYSPTAAQLDVLAERRDLVFTLPAEVGYNRVEYEGLRGSSKQRYRDLTGEFGRKGAWVSQAKIDAALEAKLEAKGIHFSKDN